MTRAPDSYVEISDLMSVEDQHQRSITGTGVVVAVIDTGIRLGLADFEGRLTKTSRAMDADGEIGDRAGHGTSMAGLIASTGAGTGLVGMAPGASLMVIRSDSMKYIGTPLISHIADGVRYATDNNADIINMSLSASRGSITSAVNYATDRNRIVLIATGNFGSSARPSDIATDVGTYGPTALAVTSVNAANQIASFASPCLVKDPKYCVAAPGVRVNTIDVNGNPVKVSGTSASTAIVSGGLALMRQYFPKLTPKEIVEILLKTTTDLGTPGVDSVYGSGLVNFHAALQPVGNLQIQAGSADAPATQSTAEMAGAFGDALARSATLAAVPVFDDYDREYQMDVRQALVAQSRRLDMLADTLDVQNMARRQSFGDLTLRYSPVIRRSYGDETRSQWGFAAVHGAAGGPQVATFLSRGDGLDPGFGSALAGADAAISQGFAQFDAAHIGVGFAAPVGAAQFTSRVLMQLENGTKAQAHASLATDLNSNLRVEGGLSALLEKGSFLNSALSGGFGHVDKSMTLAARLGAAWSHRNITATVMASYGNTYVGMAERGLIAGFGTLKSSEIHAMISIDHLFYEDDRLTFGLSRPMRISSGQMQLYDGSTVNLEPSGREQIAHLSYSARIGAAELNSRVLFGQDLGNIRAKQDQLQAQMSIGWRF